MERTTVGKHNGRPLTMDTGKKSTLDKEKITNYTHYMQLPLKLVACWEWFPKPQNIYEVTTNNVYMIFVLFILILGPIELALHLYTHWEDLMGNLGQIADTLPFLVSLAIVCYHAIYRKDLYELFDYMNENFTFHTARGLSNLTMWNSYKSGKNFAGIYTACTMFSVTMYATLPVIIYSEYIVDESNDGSVDSVYIRFFNAHLAFFLSYSQMVYEIL